MLLRLSPSHQQCEGQTDHLSFLVHQVLWASFGSFRLLDEVVQLACIIAPRSHVLVKDLDET